MKYLLSYKKHRDMENPTLDFVNSLIEEIKKKKVTEILSEGGGSIIDTGKYISRELNIPHIVFPTTAGTGSEVTKYCVLTINGKKTTLEDEKFIPHSYVLDALYLPTLSKEQKLSSRLDALCQCYESLWSTRATNESKMYASVGIHLLENPKNDMDLMIGANMSGRAINIARTNVCHSISYPLTDIFNIPHGFACYMTLKYFANKIGYHVMEIGIPKFEFYPLQVASIAVENEKLKDYPEPVTYDDIIEALIQ